MTNVAKAATQIRVARPTDQLEAVVAFYGEGLGLDEVGRFADHAGYDGVIFGLPDDSYQLEFTQHADGSPSPPPSQDNLLVFYVPDVAAGQEIAYRITRLGHHPVEAENPWWEKIDAITFEDPDGWRVVIAPTPGGSPKSDRPASCAGSASELTNDPTGRRDPRPASEQASAARCGPQAAACSSDSSR